MGGPVSQKLGQLRENLSLFSCLSDTMFLSVQITKSADLPELRMDGARWCRHAYPRKPWVQSVVKKKMERGKGQRKTSSHSRAHAQSQPWFPAERLARQGFGLSFLAAFGVACAPQGSFVNPHFNPECPKARRAKCVGFSETLLVEVCTDDMLS